jgi:hypothetical protein
MTAGVGVERMAVRHTKIRSKREQGREMAQKKVQVLIKILRNQVL